METAQYVTVSPGVGKTRLAIALAIKTCYSGISIYFTSMAALIEKLKRGAAGALTVPGYVRVALVVVDKVGYMPASRQEAYLIFQFISWRYERASLVITSNKSFMEREELLWDWVIAAAILDRLLHHGITVTIRGDSYRLKEKINAGLLKGADATA